MTMLRFLSKFSLVFALSFSLNASVPTEEGLLKNLNNSDLPGSFINLKMMVQSLTEIDKTDYVKFQLSVDHPTVVSLLQTTYSNSQMLNSQIKSVKYFPDLLVQIKKEKAPEKSLFYAILMMLTTNRPNGMEVFLEKNGVSVVKNKTLLNEDKIRLLKAYRSHLVNNKGRGEAGSPLNPEDPKNKERVLELFRANTFKRAKNIELVKRDNEFMWKVDWKSAQGFFSNEERRFRVIDYTTSDSQIKIEASSYLLFNGTNELPKFINVKDAIGQLYKVQTLGLDIKKSDKLLSDSYEELKKMPQQAETPYSFLF